MRPFQPRQKGHANYLVVWLNRQFHTSLALLGLLVIPVKAFCQSFHVAGQVTYEVVYPDGASRGKITNHFECAVQGCSWRITMTPVGRLGSLKTEMAGCDGTNIFRLTTFNTNSSLVASDKHNLNLGTIYPGLVPPSDISLISSVWLAYGSHCYFSAIKDGRCKPVWQLDDPAIQFSNISVPVNFHFSPNAPFLLARASFFSEGFLYNLTNGTALIAKKEMPPFHRGFTNATYSVARWSNDDKIPMTFSLKRFIPRYGAASANETVVWVIVNGQLESFREQMDDGFEPLPSIQAGTEVQDYRFITANPPMHDLTYSVTNANWPSFDAPHLQSQYRLLWTSRASAAGGSAVQPARFLPRAVLFATIATLPILAIFFFVRKKRIF